MITLNKIKKINTGNWPKVNHKISTKWIMHKLAKLSAWIIFSPHFIKTHFLFAVDRKKTPKRGRPLNRKVSYPRFCRLSKVLKKGSEITISEFSQTLVRGSSGIDTTCVARRARQTTELLAMGVGSSKGKYRPRKPADESYLPLTVCISEVLWVFNALCLLCEICNIHYVFFYVWIFHDLKCIKKCWLLVHG